MVLKKEACRRCQEYAFLPKRRALKGDNIYSDDDLDPTLVAHTKKTCHESLLQERMENRWPIEIIIIEERTAWPMRP